MNILDEIIAHKKEEVAERKISVPLKELLQNENLLRYGFSLKTALLQPGSLGIIAEFKRKSPSKGFINFNADVKEITKGYTENGASSLSVLTDTIFFGGNTEDLLIARKNKIPILRKDFIIDEYQLYESKIMGADVILLIAACLGEHAVKQLASRAKTLGLEVLLEVHDESELDKLCDEVDIVGINNRDLKTFRVDIERSIYLAEKIPEGMLKISESGIDSIETVIALREAGFKGFLIGEQFMKMQDPVETFKHFVNQLQEIY
ncbi:MAG: indole-3-glycerol phosphate synthase TrpC [Ferruginibacter sp.]